MDFAPRFSLVPWISTKLDLEEGRRFCWEIEHRRDVEKAICLAVADPFQKVTEAYLVIHAVKGDGNDGGDITVALSRTPQYDVFARDIFRLNQQSNPRRAQGDGDDGID